MFKTIIKLAVLVACFIGMVFIAITFLNLVKVIDWNNWRVVGFFGVITLMVVMLTGSVKSLLRDNK